MRSCRACTDGTCRYRHSCGPRKQNTTTRVGSVCYACKHDTVEQRCGLCVMWVAQGRSTTHSVKLRANFAAASFVRIKSNVVCDFASRKSLGCAFTYHCVVYTPRTPSPQAIGQISKPSRLQDARSRGMHRQQIVSLLSSSAGLKTVQPSPLGVDSKGALGPAQAKGASGHRSRPQPSVDSLPLAIACDALVRAMQIGPQRQQWAKTANLLPRGRGANLQTLL